MHKMDPVETPRDIILRNPLVGILTSLYGHLNDLRCSSEVNLQPLVVVIVFCWPGSHVSSPTAPVEPRQVRAMVPIPHRCWRNLVVLDAACLHSHWSVAKNTWSRTRSKHQLSLLIAKHFLIEQFSIECRKQSGIALVLLCCALWLVQQTRATYSTNQMQTKTNRDLVTRVFPRFTLVLIGTMWYSPFVLIGRCDYFGFGFTTLNRRELGC